MVVVSTSPAAAKTVTIDYIDDTVTVQAAGKVKVGQYKIKTMYTTKAVRLLKEPGKKSKVKLKNDTALTRIMKGTKYSVVRYKDHYYFLANKYMRTEKQDAAKYTAKQFRRLGVVHSGGWRWTWYSEKALPGGGLRIPGRHVDGNGYVCDGDNYICLASSKLKKGTVVMTPFGKKGKIYDSGCAAGTLDVYVSW